MNPDILVLTPTLGNRKSIQRTISSVETVGNGRVKHIIIAPFKEVASLQVQFPELEILAEPEDCNGIYAALNFAFKKYSEDYKYVTYINDDDYWLSDFKELFEILDSNAEIDVAYGRVNYVDETGKVIGEQTSSPRYKSFKLLLKCNVVLFTQQATLIRSDLFNKIGGFDESYRLIADTNFWMQAIDLGATLKYKKNICAAYTIQVGQLSSNRKLQKEEHIRLLSGISFNQLPLLVELLLFRILNTRIYINRFFKNKGLKRMKDLFHSNSEL